MLSIETSDKDNLRVYVVSLWAKYFTWIIAFIPEEEENNFLSALSRFLEPCNKRQGNGGRSKQKLTNMYASCALGETGRKIE